MFNMWWWMGYLISSSALEELLTPNSVMACQQHSIGDHLGEGGVFFCGVYFFFLSPFN